MAQTWNNVLSYIKLELGSKLNLIELTDSELIEGFKDHVIPYFSQYLPAKQETWITSENRIKTKPGQNCWTYKIPVPLGTYIIDIEDAYPLSTGGNGYTDSDPYYGTKYSRDNIRGNVSGYGDGGYGLPFGDLINVVMDNTYLDMADSLSVKNTYEFEPPDLISFDQELVQACIVYNTIHTDLNTIQPDYFNTVFKDMCLVKAIDWIVALRSKYDSLATPVGEIKMNWDKLEEKANTKRDDINTRLAAVPLDKFLEVS